jgi:PAS domain S-box-containing protein
MSPISGRSASAQPEALEAVAAHANDIILVTEAAPPSEPGPRITYVNSAFNELTGYEFDEVIGKSPRILQGPDTDEETLAEVRTALEHRESIRVEILNYTKDGRPYWLEMDISPVFDSAGNCTRFVAIERDVTARKRREQQLEMLREMLSHDVRKEIGKTVSWLDVAKSKDPSADVRSPIRKAEDGAARAVDMIGTVDALLHGLLGGREMETEPTDLRRHLEEVVEAIGRRFPEGTINLDLSAGEQFEVEANGMVQSIFENLISNGLEHNASDTPRVRIRAEVHSRFVEVVVSDNGPGIPEEISETLFSDGVQGAASTGSGMGLFLARSLTELFGGDIEVEKRQSGGTAFSLRLPRP